MDLITALETELLWLIQRTLQAPWMDRMMIFFSTLGNGGMLWVLLTVLLLCFRKTRRTGAAMAIAMLFCLLVGNFGLKPLIARARPFTADPSITLLIEPPGEYSFPSGHTMNSFAAAWALALSNRWCGIWALLTASLIAFSRLYLMVHYPTDVFAGILVGIAGGWIGYRLSQRILPQ